MIPVIEGDDYYNLIKMIEQLRDQAMKQKEEALENNRGGKKMYCQGKADALTELKGLMTFYVMMKKEEGEE